MQLFVHYPKTKKGRAEFDYRVSKFHAEYVVHYINKLRCPVEQKLRLVDAIIKTIRENKGK